MTSSNVALIVVSLIGVGSYSSSIAFAQDSSKIDHPVDLQAFQVKVAQPEKIFCETGTFVFGSTNVAGSFPGLTLSYANGDTFDEDSSGDIKVSLVDCLKLHKKVDMFFGFSTRQTSDMFNQSQLSLGISPTTDNIWNGLKIGLIGENEDDEDNLFLAADLIFFDDSTFTGKNKLVDGFILQVRQQVLNGDRFDFFGQVRINHRNLLR